MDSSSGAYDPPDELHSLAPSSRMPSARTRLGIGAAIVLFLVALVVAVVISALSGGGANDRVSLGDPSSAGDGATASGTPTQSALDEGGPVEGAHVYVHVLGAVANPGLYELSAGSRVVDVVSAAGGFTDDADPGGVNLARLLTDAEQFSVPRMGEVPPLPPAGGAMSGADAAGSGVGSSLVNLNTATQGDLETLPRIGPSLAQRILDWREANGGFSSVDDLRNVTGIGEKTFDGLKELVSV